MARRSSASPRQSPNIPLDYSGQKLAGRSFRGQNLAGASFRNCDLRGVDFREADLIGVDFTGARMGKAWRRQVVDFVIGSAIGAFWEISSMFLTAILFTTLVQIAEGFPDIKWSEPRGFAAAVFSCVAFIAAARSFRAGRIKLEAWIITGAFFSLAFSTILSSDGTMAKAMSGAGAGAGALAMAVAGTGAIAGAIAGAGTMAVAGTIAGAVAWTAGWAVAFPESGLGIWDVTVTLLGMILTGQWLARQATHHQCPELDWLRRWSLNWGCRGGTDFRGAHLSRTIFESADMRMARLAEASLVYTRWRGALNLHRAYTYGSILQPRAVRELMTTGSGIGTNLRGFDLRGLDCSGMSLAEADFTDADLSGALFVGADLTAANLTRAVVLGTDFTRARLTGARIDHWNLDKHTYFESAECDYVFLDEDGRERQPAEGRDFEPGEFAKLYQEIAGTVDFLIENPAQMDALLAALNKVRSDYDDPDVAQIRKVEDKNGSLKVSVAVAPEIEDNLRRELHQGYESRIKALEAEHRVALLEQKAEFLERESQFKGQALEQLLKSRHEQHNHIITQVGSNPMIDDHSHNINSSNFHGSQISQGDHASNQMTIQGSDTATLATKLDELREAIRQSQELPEADKKTALEKVEALKQAAEQPQPQGQLTAAKALGSLETLGKVVKGASDILAVIDKLYGLA